MTSETLKAQDVVMLRNDTVKLELAGVEKDVAI
jgi:hypothetical protein